MKETQGNQSFSKLLTCTSRFCKNDALKEREKKHNIMIQNTNEYNQNEVSFKKKID